MTRPLISHRGPEMAALLERIQPSLQQVFRTSRPVMVATSSSTGLMEAAVLAGVQQRVLVVVGGFFGERFAQVAEACGKEVVRVMIPEGSGIEVSQLARFFDGPEVDAVALVHSETSTGALAPLREIATEVRRRADVMLLVDAVSSVGGLPVETDAWGLDFVFTGSQKALALPPGLAFGVASRRLMERARANGGRGWYFDLVKLEAAAIESMPTQTPAVSLLFALDRQLARIEAAGGIEARWARHALMRERVERWCDDGSGYALLAPPGRRSWTVSALRLPPGRDAYALVARLAAQGFTVTTGLPPLDRDVIRIGHMGEVTPAELDVLLAALSDND